MGQALQWALLSLIFSSSVASGCPGEKSLKQVVCLQSGPLGPGFDPCLCTHLVLDKSLNDLTSGDVKSAVVGLKSVNPDLAVLGPWSPGSSQIEPGALAKKADLLELDGVFFQAPEDHAPKTPLHQLVKELATEFDNLRSSKRANEKYQQDTTKSVSSTGIVVELPTSPQALGKHYDLKKLSKYVDYYVLASSNITDASEAGLSYHPSRLMGIDDVLNADSLVDLVSGLGAPREKLILALPGSASVFTLADPEKNMPRSAVTGSPRTVSQPELCTMLEEGGWTVERDEDLTAPYAYRNTTWIAYDDPTSAAIKGKYILLRELGGAAVDSVELEDWEGRCKGSGQTGVVRTLHETFTSVARKPRAAQLLALQNQIHQAYNLPYSDVELSPYRIVRVVDRAGSIHVVRKEAKTEFTCSRQGYFTHPTGCNRFYRCVKFNQESSDFTVFEYDCPAGLAFDERYEVCVWPGSLPDANPCRGSSEIAPVPRTRFNCPSVEGYYADPENCRWFFACLDHRRDGSQLTGYEFRCPFGLVFNEKSLVCDWPWLVEGCGSGSATSARSGYTAGDILEGRLRPSYAHISDVHVSGGRIENVDGGYVLGSSLTSGLGGIQGYKGESSNVNAGHLGVNGNLASNNVYTRVGGLGNSVNNADNSGAYVHDPTGDHGGEYVHKEGPGSLYVHQEGPGSLYVHDASRDGAYVGSNLGVKTSGLGVGAARDNSGIYVHQSTGDKGGNYIHSGGLGSGYTLQDGSKGATYLGSNVGLASGSISGLGQAVEGNSGAYIHDSSGDQGGNYIHQEGGANIDGYGKGAIYGGSTAGLRTSGVGLEQSAVDNSGAYIHDSRGDHGGDYAHQEGIGSTNFINANQGSGYLGSTVAGLNTVSGGGLGLTQGNVDSGKTFIQGLDGNYGKNLGSSQFFGKSQGSGYLNSNVGQKATAGLGLSGVDDRTVFIQDSAGNQGGNYIHQNNRGFAAGANKGTAYIGTTIGLKTNSGTTDINLDNSGAYVHDSSGDRGGDYIHQDIPALNYVVGVDKGSISSSSLGQRTSAGVGYSADQDNGGAYIHDNSGDHGGDYIHQEGLGTAYIKGSELDGLSGLKETGALYSGNYNLANNNRATYHASNLQTDNAVNSLNKASVSQIGQVADTSGQYVHDSRGDYGGEYVHQGIRDGGYRQEGLRGSAILGSSGVGGAYIHDTTGDVGSAFIQGKNVYTGKTNLYQGKIQDGVKFTSFSSGSSGISGNDGQYVHDTTGDHGGEYIHQEGPHGPGYVHDSRNDFVAGLYNGQVVDQGKYYAGNFENYNNKFNLLGAQQGAYIHDNRGDYIQQVSGHYVPQSYNTGAYTVGTQANYAGGYGGYLKQISNNRPINAYVTKFSNQHASGLVPNSVVTNIQPVSYEGIGGAAFSDVKQTYNGGVGVIKTAVPSQPIYHVTTPKPVSTYQSVVSTPLQTSFQSGHLTNQYTAAVSPIVVSSTPVVPLNPVQYTTVTKKPLISYNQVNAGVQYAVNTPSAPVVSHSYKQPVNTFTITGQPTVPFAPVTTPLPPVAKINFYESKVSQPVIPSVIYTQPKTVVQPLKILKTPNVPLNPVQYVQPVVSTPAPPLVVNSVHQAPITTQEHLSFIQEPVVNTYHQPAVVRTNYNTISTPAPPVASYTFGTRIQPAQVVHTQKLFEEKRPNIKFIQQPVVVSTTPLPSVDSIKYVNTVKPIVISTPAPFKTHSESISVANAPVLPLNPVQYVQPIINSPAPPVVSYSYKSPSFVQTNYEQVKPAVVRYQQPAIKTAFLQPAVVSTTTAVPLNPIQYLKPVQVPSEYSYQRPVPIKSYEIPLSTYKQPLVETKIVEQKPLKVNLITTPAPTIYQQENSVGQCVNCASPSLNIKLEKEIAQPIPVSTTPVIPLAPVQYIKPVKTFSSFSYSQQQPIKEVSTYEEQQKELYQSYIPRKEFLAPLPAVSTPAPPILNYIHQDQEHLRPVSAYEEQRQVINQYSRQPFAGPSYLPPASVVSSTYTPPIVSYSSYEQAPIKPVSLVKETYGSKISYQPITKVVSTTAAPPINYSFKQETIKPLVVSTPAYPKVTLPPIAPIVSSTPTPIFSYSYEQSPIIKSNIKSVELSQSPYIPLSVNGTLLYGRPVPVRGCTICSLVENNQGTETSVNYGQYQSGYNSYHYQGGNLKTGYEFQPGSYIQTKEKPIFPAYQYEQQSYQVNQDFASSKPCTNCVNSQSGSISVSSTPIVPSYKIQYVTTTSPPIKQAQPIKTVQPVVTEYRYQQPSISLQGQSLIKETIRTPIRPVELQKTITNIQPITFTTTPVIPLNKVQYITKTTPYVVSTTPASVAYTDAHLYEINKVTSGQPPLSVPVITNRPVTITPSVKPITYEVHNQHNFVKTQSRLSTPTPFRTQYVENKDYSFGVPLAPVNVVKEKPTAVFEEYYGYNKNNFESNGNINTHIKYEEVRFPSVTYSTPVPTLSPVSYETRVPVKQFQTTVTPVSPDIKYTVRYRQPSTIIKENVDSVLTADQFEDINAHIDLARVNLDSREQYFIPTSTFTPSTAKPTVQRVKVNEGQGYYVRKQKVRVRPVVTTTENYPSVFTSSYKPVVYSTTLDLTSPTFYTTTARPIVTSTVSSAELDIETSDEDQKLVDEVSGNFGEVINVGNQGVIEQRVESVSGFSSTTISSLKDGEAIVGVIKKSRVNGEGRKKAKVVVVSRLSDFNPILVGKLGAQCSCQDGEGENVRKVAVKRVKGRLFTPQTSTAQYVETEGFASSTTLSPFEGSVVEIKPLRKSQRIYPSDTSYSASVDRSSVTRVPTGVKAAADRKQELTNSKQNAVTDEERNSADLVARGSIECQRAGLFRHPKHCNKFYSCNWDPWKKKFTLSVFNCPIHLAYDSNLGACNWPSKGPACADDNLLV